MEDRSKELAKNTFIITLGRVSTQFISFLLLPLYTTLLSNEQYGTVDLITTLVQLLIPVVSIMIDQGVFRYLLNCETETEKKKTISSAFFLLTATCVIACVVYCIISIFVPNQYKHWLLLILIATTFSNLFLQAARGLKHTRDYALGSFVCSASTIILNVLCIAFLRMGAVGMLAATFAGNAICCMFLFFKLKIARYISVSAIDRNIAKDELKYSSPLVPNQLSLWVMNSSDRLIVTFFLGAAANGILAVSHKFPAIYMTFFNIFQLAWHETGAIHYYDQDRDQFFTDSLKRTLSIFSTLCMGIIIALPIVFNWFVNKAFDEAYYNIPIYLVAFLFNVIIGLLGVVYVATKKTTEIAKTTMAAAVINIIVHLTLIKFIGLFAASISTLVGYGVTMIYRIIDTKKYLKIKYDIKQFVGTGSAILFCMFLYYLNNRIISVIFIPFFIICAYLFNYETVGDFMRVISGKIEKSGNKKLFVIIVMAVTFTLAMAAGCYIYGKATTSPKIINTDYKGNVQNISAKQIILFSNFGEENFTCTGLTYDKKEDSFWIGDYGKSPLNGVIFPRIVEVDKNFQNVLRVILLNDILDSSANLQGITYDDNDDSLWLAVGDCIIELNKEIQIVRKIQLGRYSKYSANGISYCEDDTLWVLCASQYLLHYSKDGALLNEFPFNYLDQDHIVLDGKHFFATIGADYRGNNNFIGKIDMSDGSITSLYRIEQSNAMEGICIVDGKVIIANDGFYHSDLVGQSYIVIYDIKDFT